MKMDEVLRLATDGPWEVQERDEGAFWILEIHAVDQPNRIPITEIQMGFEDDFDAEQRASAALIIRARNTFVDAVEALEKMINIADGSEPCVGEDFKLKLAQARATLARMMEDV